MEDPTTDVKTLAKDEITKLAPVDNRPKAKKQKVEDTKEETKPMKRPASKKATSTAQPKATSTAQPTAASKAQPKAASTAQPKTASKAQPKAATTNNDAEGSETLESASESFDEVADFWN